MEYACLVISEIPTTLEYLSNSTVVLSKPRVSIKPMIFLNSILLFQVKASKFNLTRFKTSSAPINSKNSLTISQDPVKKHQPKHYIY